MSDPLQTLLEVAPEQVKAEMDGLKITVTCRQAGLDLCGLPFLLMRALVPILTLVTGVSALVGMLTGATTVTMGIVCTMLSYIGALAAVKRMHVTRTFSLDRTVLRLGRTRIPVVDLVGARVSFGDDDLMDDSIGSDFTLILEDNERRRVYALASEEDVEVAEWFCDAILWLNAQRAGESAENRARLASLHARLTQRRG